MTALASVTQARPADVGRASVVDARVRTATTVAFWASTLLVTYWWVADGGIGDLSGWASALNSLGRITGLVAANLLLVEVLLISRIPVIERAYGQDRILHLHRLVGFTSFWLMAAHILLNTWGYAGGVFSAIPAMFWDLTVTFPGMLLALLGTISLIMVVVTSVRAARRKLRYESWHLLHLYAYLGVGLALPHQLWTGQQFVDSTAATVYWWTLWALAAAAVLVWRVAVPLLRSSRHQLRVTSVVYEGDGVRSVYMTGRDMSDLRADAGQFFTWRFLGREGWTRGNPYSLSAAPDGRSLRVSIKNLGDNSGRTGRIRPGARVLVEGPYGRLTERARTRERVAFIGSGVGIAPLRALAESMVYRPGEATVLYRFSGTPIFEREFAILARERGLHVAMLGGHRRSPNSWVGDWAGPHDDVGVLRQLVPDIATRDLFICGPTPWADSVRAAALAAGVQPEQIHIEAFGW